MFVTVFNQFVYLLPNNKNITLDLLWSQKNIETYVQNQMFKYAPESKGPWRYT